MSSLENHSFSSFCLYFNQAVCAFDVEFHELLVYVDYESLVGDPRILKQHAEPIPGPESGVNRKVLDVGAFSEAEMPTL